MLTITDTQKEKFKNIVNKQYTSEIKFINIMILNDIPNIIDYLLINNTSFNYLIDKDGIYNLVSEGFATNGGYKIVKTVYCNQNVEHLTFGIIVKDEKDIIEQMIHLKQKLYDFSVTKKIRLITNGNTYVLTPGKDDYLYKNISKQYILDTTFKYVRDLFSICY